MYVSIHRNRTISASLTLCHILRQTKPKCCKKNESHLRRLSCSPLLHLIFGLSPTKSAYPAKSLKRKWKDGKCCHQTFVAVDKRRAFSQKSHSGTIVDDLGDADEAHPHAEAHQPPCFGWTLVHTHFFIISIFHSICLCWKARWSKTLPRPVCTLSHMDLWCKKH